MNELFLSENERSKLMVLEAILRNSQLTSVNAIKKTLGFSYSKSKLLITELEDELQDYFDTGLIGTGGKLQRPLNRGLIIEYRDLLIKKSVAYRFLFNYLTDESYTFQQLCEDSFVSRASVFRKLKSLKDHLAEHEIKMKATQMQLLGEEHMIRTVLFNLFWLVDRGADLSGAVCLSPHTYGISTKWAENISLAEIQLFLSIALCRYQRWAFITTEIFAGYQRPESAQSIKVFLRGAVPQEQLDKELTFFGYFFTYQHWYFDPEDRRIVFLIESYRDTPTDIVTSHFLALCGPYFCIESLPPKDRKLLYVNMLNTFNRFAIVGKTLPAISEVELKYGAEALRQDPVWCLIYRLLRRLTAQRQNQWLKKALEQLADNCYLHLFAYFELEPPRKLQVIVKNDPNYYLVRKVYEFCQQTPFIQAAIKGDIQTEHQTEVVLKPSTASLVEVHLLVAGIEGIHYFAVDEFEQMRELLYTCHQCCQRQSPGKSEVDDLIAIAF